MTLPQLTFEELKQILADNGFNLVSTDFFTEHTMVVFAKGDHSFVIEWRKVYFYRFVVFFLTQLDIEPPKDCMKAYQQEQELYKKIREGDK
jgi:hypothetical protein